jgi:ribosome maturation factor RimP
MHFSDTETKIFSLLDKTINLLGFDLVLVTMASEGARTLKIIIDGQNGVKLNIDDCQKVSKAVAPVLDVEDLITGKYILEVASSGVERPLVKRQDYLRFINYVILVKLNTAIDGKKKYKGDLIEVDESHIVVNAREGDGAVKKTLPFSSIKSCNLVMTDEIFRAILKS